MIEEIASINKKASESVSLKHYKLNPLIENCLRIDESKKSNSWVPRLLKIKKISPHVSKEGYRQNSTLNLENFI